MNLEEILTKIENDPDFIYIKRFDYSLKKLLERYPDGAPDKLIGQALQMEETDIANLYQQIVAKLKKKLDKNDSQPT